MIVIPQLRPEIFGEGCRVPRWMPAERFAPYFASRTQVLSHYPPQEEDDDSQRGSSPEQTNEASDAGEGVCWWRGCGARLPSVARLSAHVARVHAHAHRDGLFYCCWKDCTRPQRGFNARYKMLVHVRTHTNERPHTCNQCQKSFSRAENLKIHLRSHSGEKPYVCPYEGCGKAYSNSSDRFKHTRTHTVDKPYCCKVPGCNKRYTDPSSLRKHVKTYKHFTNEKDIRRENSVERQSSDSSSPARENNPYVITPSSPQYLSYSPPRVPYTPVSYSDTALGAPIGYTPLKEQITYIRPIEQIYPIRVPSHEMTYLEYSQMYDHTYRNYYNYGLSYSALRPSIDEKVLTYEEQRRYEDVIIESAPEKYECVEEAPLNLICSKRLDCKPIDDLVRYTDLPLDLSNKS